MGTHGPAADAGLDGGRMRRGYGRLTRRLAAEVLTRHPHLAAYPDAVASWATWEARAQSMRRHLARVGDLDENGRLRKEEVHWFATCEREARAARATLGLDPRSAISLARDRAQTVIATTNLAEFAAANRDDRLARERALEAPDDTVEAELILEEDR